MGFFSMGCILIGVLLVPAAVKRFGKKQVYLGGLILWAVGDILNFIWGGTSFLFVIFSCMAFFGTAFVNSLNWALVPDTVDYGEWKTGIRAEGSVYTGYTFSHKNFRCACWLFARYYADANRLYPQHRSKWHHVAWFASAHFLWPCGLAIIAALTMGFFISSMNNVSLLLSRKLLNERKQAIRLSRLIINKVFLL